MSSTPPSRDYLAYLARAAHKAESSVREAEDVEHGFSIRQRRRMAFLGGSIYSDEEQDDEDLTEHFSDEDEEGFDAEVQGKKLERATNQCKLDAIAAHRNFIAALEAYAKANSVSTLMSLHNNIHAKLPIELRNMIFSHLVSRTWEDWRYHTIHGTTVHFSPEAFDHNFQAYEWHSVDESLRLARVANEHGTYDVFKAGGWLMNPEYVGQGLARDISEILYTIKDFQVDIYHLKEMLLVDRSQTGLKPYEHICRRIRLRIPTTMWGESNELVWKTSATEIAFLNNIYKQLNLLKLIKQNSKVSLELELLTTNPSYSHPEAGERCFYNIMESVRAPIYDLIHAGYAVKLFHINTRNSHRELISEGSLNLFGLSKKQWEVEKAGHNDDWLPAKEFFPREKLHEKSAGKQLDKLFKRRWGGPSFHPYTGASPRCSFSSSE